MVFQRARTLSESRCRARRFGAAHTTVKWQSPFRFGAGRRPFRGRRGALVCLGVCEAWSRDQPPFVSGPASLGLRAPRLRARRPTPETAKSRPFRGRSPLVSGPLTLALGAGLPGLAGCLATSGRRPFRGRPPGVSGPLTLALGAGLPGLAGCLATSGRRPFRGRPPVVSGPLTLALGAGLPGLAGCLATSGRRPFWGRPPGVSGPAAFGLVSGRFGAARTGIFGTFEPPFLLLLGQNSDMSRRWI